MMYASKAEHKNLVSTFKKKIHALSHLGGLENVIFDMSERIKKTSLDKIDVICLH